MEYQFQLRQRRKSHRCREASNTVWSHMACNIPYSGVIFVISIRFAFLFTYVPVCPVVTTNRSVARLNLVKIQQWELQISATQCCVLHACAIHSNSQQINTQSHPMILHVLREILSLNVVNVLRFYVPHSWAIVWNRLYRKSGQLTIADRCALIFKVTQGHWLIQSKTYIHDFLLVINWDLSSISHRLQDMNLKTTPPYFQTPISRDPLIIVIKLNKHIAVGLCYFIVKTTWF